MLPLTHIDGPKHIVNTTYRHILTIHSGCPSGIVDIREDDDAASGRVYIVFKFVCIIGCEGDYRCGILGH